MKKIKYLGYYSDSFVEEEKRNYNLAAKTKMDYISNKLVNLGYEVEIVSPSHTSQRKFFSGKKIYIKKNIYLKLFFTTPHGGIIARMINRLVRSFLLIFYLIFFVKKNEEIIVYHSLALITPLKIAQTIKKFKVILEVEEIYTDIIDCTFKTKIKELAFINNADKYIFSTELLEERINKRKKPSVILYGTYDLPQLKDICHNDNKIHLVYAGTFDFKKAGARIAIEASKYLDDRYHLHIIGFGTKEEKHKIIDLARKSSELQLCKVTYDGELKDQEYLDFLQKSDIGLSTQISVGEYNNSSFPSKVLSYMVNGLHVVSARIDVLEKSKINDFIYYYEDNKPQKIAEVIKSINIKSNSSNRDYIRKLDLDFEKNFKQLLEK